MSILGLSPRPGGLALPPTAGYVRNVSPGGRWRNEPFKRPQKGQTEMRHIAYAVEGRNRCTPIFCIPWWWVRALLR